MDREQQKKKRGENWSPEEKEILRQLISQSAQIIEDKSTKTNVNIKKTKEWKNLSDKFNEITGKRRSIAELKLAWKRMKLSAKSNISAHRMEQTRTGGGEKPPSPTAEDLQVMAIAPYDFIIEVNDYDSDAMMAATTTKDMSVDPKPGPSYPVGDPITINEENPELSVRGSQAISNNVTGATEADKSPVKKRSKILQSKNRSEEMRQIVKSNIDLKKRQLEIMEIEHEYNVKVSKLKIKKLELQIAILETKKNSNTED